MDFIDFKINIIETTGLAKDALHIYVGVGVYLICLLILRPVLRKYSIRAFIAIVLVTTAAVAGEYLDNQHTIDTLGVTELNREQLVGSIRDLINTCLLPYLLFVLTMWTKLFQSVSPATKMLKQRS